jgi:integrase
MAKRTKQGTARTHPQPAIDNLARLLEVVDGDESLPVRRRRDLRSAFRTLARVLSEDLECLPADRALLRERLGTVHPALAGLSSKRWQNVRSELSFALGYVGSPPRPRRLKLTRSWRFLYRKLPDKRLRNGLSSFIRFCSEHGIPPTDVNDDVSREFRRYLEKQTFQRDPLRAQRQACRLWNEVSGVIPSWPKATLAVPRSRSAGFALPWNEFPRSFRGDVNHYLDWLAGGQGGDRAPPRRACKPSTVALRLRHLHQLASAAVLRGYDAKFITSLRDLTSRRAVERALAFYATRGAQGAGYLGDLGKTLTGVAEHWAGAPSDHVAWIRDRFRAAAPGPDGTGSTNPRPRAQLDSARNRELLYALPARLADAARRMTESAPRQAAVRFQTAVAVDLLLLVPVRIGQLVGLRVDDGLHEPQGRGGPLHLCVRDHANGGEVLTDRALPESTRELLNEYMAAHRRSLGPPISPWLFPSEEIDRPKQAESLSRQVTRTVTRETGLRLTPAQFRHLAATRYLEEGPDGLEALQRVLGQRSVRASKKLRRLMVERTA